MANKKYDTSHPEFVQLDMFRDIITDNRPIPEIVASDNGFELTYQYHNGICYYPVHDWIRGVAQLPDNKAAGNFWRAMLRRFAKDGIESSTLCTPLPYRASDGKTYQRDHATAETLYKITQRMDTSTGIRNAVLEYLAKAGVKLDEWRLDPDQGIAQLTDFRERKEYARLIADGMPPDEAMQWVDTRNKQKGQRHGITREWGDRGAVGRDYATLSNAVMRGATGKTATQLKTQLQVTNPRDHLSAAENAAVMGIELFSSILHVSRNSQGVSELQDDIGDGSSMIDRQAIERAFSKRRPM